MECAFCPQVGDEHIRILIGHDFVDIVEVANQIVGFLQDENVADVEHAIVEFVAPQNMFKVTPK